jgi:hypothetical protein
VSGDGGRTMTAPPSRPEARRLVGVCGKYQRDQAHYVDPGVGQLLHGLFGKFFRSTHSRSF